MKQYRTWTAIIHSFSIKLFNSQRHFKSYCKFPLVSRASKEQWRTNEEMERGRIHTGTCTLTYRKITQYVIKAFDEILHVAPMLYVKALSDFQANRCHIFCRWMQLNGTQIMIDNPVISGYPMWMKQSSLDTKGIFGLGISFSTQASISEWQVISHVIWSFEISSLKINNLWVNWKVDNYGL